MIVANGSTDVTTYFVLRDSTSHAPKTDVTITDIDVYYLEQGAAIAAKADLTALAAADSAHADNKGYHCGQGLYRIDWPDEAFNGGVGKRAYLIVVCTGVDTEICEVELSPPVNMNSVTNDAITAAALAADACTEINTAVLAAIALCATPAEVSTEVIDALTHDVMCDGLSIQATLQIIAAAVAGKMSGAGTGTEIFVGIDGVTTRIVGTVDSSGNRTGATYSGT